MRDLEHLTKQKVEWEAWQEAIRRLAEVLPEGSNLNGETYRPFFTAIQRWGEELVALRVDQTRVDRERALAEARAAAGVR